MKNLVRILTLLIIVVLSFSVLTACKKDTEDTPIPGSATLQDSNDGNKKYNILYDRGEEFVKYTFKVTHANGEKTEFKLDTKEDNLGDALLEFNLVAGDDSQYGLYVKTVDGERADYTLDGAYWCFYKNGEILNVGVSETPIEEGAQYEAVYTKAQ